MKMKKRVRKAFKRSRKFLRDHQEVQVMLGAAAGYLLVRLVPWRAILPDGFREELEKEGLIPKGRQAEEQVVQH